MDDYYINETFQELKHHEPFKLHLEWITNILLVSLTLILDLFIIYSIDKYVELRRKWDVLISNWCILNLIPHFITILYMLLDITKFINFIGYSLICVALVGMMTVILIFMVDDIYDGITENNIKLWMVTFRTALISLLIFELIIRYFKNWFITTYFFLPLCLLVFLLYLAKSCIVFVSYVRKKNVSDEFTFRYTLCSIFVWCRTLEFLLILPKIKFPDVTIIQLIEFLQLVFMLLLLIKFNTDFKEHILKLLQRKKPNDSTRTTTPSVYYNNVQTV